MREYTRAVGADHPDVTEWRWPARPGG